MKLWRYEGVKTIAQSPPSRGAWIEMWLWEAYMQRRVVAPLAGGVD